MSKNLNVSTIAPSMIILYLFSLANNIHTCNLLGLARRQGTHIQFSGLWPCLFTPAITIILLVFSLSESSYVISVQLCFAASL